MSKPYIMHMITPAKHVSPFDVNMACDAGWTTVIPYTHAEAAEVTGLVQDAIFSRGPKGVKHTGIFIGGRDVNQAMDMLQLSVDAMVPPFEVSVMVDPSGAFTTAAALVACAERQLQVAHAAALAGQRLLVFGGSGPVGTAACVLAAGAGAEVAIVGHDGSEAASRVASSCKQRYGVDIEALDGSTDARKQALLADVDVVFSTAKAGVQVLSSAQLQSAVALKVAGDLNAVPPLGIEGVDLMDDGASIAGLKQAVGIGALAIGNVKYQVQQQLLKAMATTDTPLYLDFRQAFDRAREYVKAA